MDARTWGVGMRADCKHYETRTYASGEVARMCRLDLAPDAPWRCPADCPKFVRRAYDAGWTVGSLHPRETPPPPETLDENAAALLDAAEEVINAVGPKVIAEVQRTRAAARAEAETSWFQRFRSRFPRRRG